MLFAPEVYAQEGEQTTIRIEAEIISGLDAGALSSGPSTAVQTSPLQAPAGTTGVAPVLGGADNGAQAAGVQPTAAQLSQTASVDDVARNLVASAQTGALTIADTAMVAALSAGQRSQRQNVESLVTITVIDETGGIRSTTMRNTDLRADMLGPSIGAGVFGAPIQQTTQAVLTGDVMRRSSGVTYFYVQVCSCGL